MKKTLPKPLRYTVVITYSDEDHCYIASVPALRGCRTHGSTYAKAAAAAQEAMEVWLEGALRNGERLPEPDTLERR